MFIPPPTGEEKYPLNEEYISNFKKKWEGKSYDDIKKEIDRPIKILTIIFIIFIIFVILEYIHIIRFHEFLYNVIIVIIFRVFHLYLTYTKTDKERALSHFHDNMRHEVMTKIKEERQGDDNPDKIKELKERLNTIKNVENEEIAKKLILIKDE